MAAASRALFVMESYGSDIWGGFEKCEGFDKSNIYDKFYVGFLKRVLKVPAGTDSWILATEFGKNPISRYLLHQTAGVTEPGRDLLN